MPSQRHRDHFFEIVNLASLLCYIMYCRHVNTRRHITIRRVHLRHTRAYKIGLSACYDADFDYIVLSFNN